MQQPFGSAAAVCLSVYTFSTAKIASTSRSTGTGLVRKPSMPAARHSSWEATNAFAVIARIGTSLPAARINCVADRQTGGSGGGHWGLGTDQQHNRQTERHRQTDRRTDRQIEVQPRATGSRARGQIVACTAFNAIAELATRTSAATRADGRTDGIGRRTDRHTASRENDLRLCGLDPHTPLHWANSCGLDIDHAQYDPAPLVI
jgi:hypothetical protein